MMNILTLIQAFYLGGALQCAGQMYNARSHGMSLYANFDTSINTCMHRMLPVQVQLEMLMSEAKRVMRLTQSH